MTSTHPLETALGYSFTDPSLLTQALTHSTYANEHPEQGEHNERLEFLGDAVVGLLVADLLFDLYDAHEGQMTKRRARVVRREGLAAIARRINLGEYLLLGAGQQRAGGHDSDRLLADGFEALVAAVFRDGGMERVRQHFGELFADAIRASANPLDFKTTLQEWVHARGLESPEYRVVDTQGPDHAREYQVEVIIDGAVAGTGLGTSKKIAEQAAAQVAFEAREVSP